MVSNSQDKRSYRNFGGVMENEKECERLAKQIVVNSNRAIPCGGEVFKGMASTLVNEITQALTSHGKALSVEEIEKVIKSWYLEGNPAGQVFCQFGAGKDLAKAIHKAMEERT